MPDIKLINTKETRISILQAIGFILMLLGISSFIVSSFYDDAIIPSIIAVSFFITMLGYSFAFPSLLEGNEGISTMRIVVFMMTNIICMLLLKIGWAKGITSLESIGLDQYWMGVIAFVFGAKATQSMFESNMAKPLAKSSDGMAGVTYSNAEIAKLALAQNAQFLKVKFPNIVSVSDAVHDLNNVESHAIALYLKDNNIQGIPEKLEVKMADGTIKTIPTEIITNVGSGSIQLLQLDAMSNTAQTKGSICCVVEMKDGSQGVVSSGHVYSDGTGASVNGFNASGDALINGTKCGHWVFQLINMKNDVSVATINMANNNDYIRFKGKQHYEVTDKDVKKTKVILKSLISQTRSGYILDHHTNWYVDYFDDTYFKSQIILIGSEADKEKSKTLSEHGDSGGCVYEEISGNLVGIILGGNDKFTWVLPLKEVFENNNFKLV